MHYVGIDIAKDNHYASIVDTTGKIIVSPFLVTNNKLGFESLLDVLKNFNKDELLIGLEATSYYGLNLMKFLFEQGYCLAVINPIQTASARKDNVRKTKNDKVDSIVVANTITRGKFTPLTQGYLDSLSLRFLARFRQYLKIEKQINKTRLSQYVNMIFPELEIYFKDNIHINTSYQLLKVCSNHADIAKLNLTRLTNLFRKASHGRYGRSKALELKKLAHNSIGINSKSLAIQIRLTIEHIEFLENQMKELENEIALIINEISNPLKSIKGISNLTIANILGEIADITRFSNPNQVVAFAGLDPTVSQSGQFSAKCTRMSKRGSSLLRYSLIYASHNIIKNGNKTFNHYYNKKRREGKSYYNALGHCGKKLARIIFVMLRDNVNFNLD